MFSNEIVLSFFDEQEANKAIAEIESNSFFMIYVVYNATKAQRHKVTLSFILINNTTSTEI